MRAVWSFWSRPFHDYYGSIWCKPLHHLLAWGLSVRAASRHYPETVLITDRAGKDLLASRLGLRFAQITTDLEQLNNADPDWWALGKLLAYSLQDAPFVHLDSDVFLWKPLPRHLQEAPVFAQNSESCGACESFYHPERVEQAFAQHSLKLPVEWEWTRSNRARILAETCGIFGGSNLEFIRHFARTAIDLIQRPEHTAAWSRVGYKPDFNIVLEQFLLAACVEYHSAHRSSPFYGVRIEHLFPTAEAPFNPNHAARTGFTHLIAGGKTHPGVGARLEARLWREDPVYFRRCERVLSGQA
jgi:hypothetical protein